MAPTASITIRLDPQLKSEAAAIVEDFGLDLTSVTRAFYAQIVREHRIPLSLSYPKPNEESRASIRAANEIIAQGTARFDNLEDMLTDLGE